MNTDFSIKNLKLEGLQLITPFCREDARGYFVKNFEKDTLTKEANSQKTAALTKLFKGANVSDSATKLLIASKALDEIELDDKGEIKGGADILKKAKADYADLFAANGNSGVPQSPDGNGGAIENKRAKFY